MEHQEKECKTLIQQQFLVPGGIDIPAVLAALGYGTQYIYDHQDKFNYVLHKILEQRVFNSSVTAVGYSCLHLDTLRDVLGRRYADHVLDTLLSLEIIQCDEKKLYGNYGSKSYGYRIHPDLVSKAVLHSVFKEETMGKKLRHLAYCYKQKQSKKLVWKNLKKLHIHDQDAYAFIDAKYNTSLEILDRYQGMTQVLMTRANQKHILATYAAINQELAAHEDEARSLYKEWSYSPTNLPPSPPPYPLIPVHLVKILLLNSDNQFVTLDNYCRSLFINQYNSDWMSIRKFVQRDFFVEQPDPTSRVYTNLCNLSSDLRRFLYHTEHVFAELVNLDIRNSQPYLFSLLLMDKYRGSILPDRAAQYIKLTANGQFYEHMMGLLGYELDTITKRQRDAFKQKFFASLFFCKPFISQVTKEGNMFRKHFPEVAELIDAHKAQGYEQLAITMQRREAGVILNTIGSQLAQEGIWFATIHDSVVVLKEHQEHVHALIIQAFLDEVGVAPTVKAEPLRPAVNAAVVVKPQAVVAAPALTENEWLDEVMKKLEGLSDLDCPLLNDQEDEEDGLPLIAELSSLSNEEFFRY